MKIAIVGPGIMPIPPTGWGAVEILIWDQKLALEKLGHEVQIVNTQSPIDIIKQINSFNYKEKTVKNPIIKIQIGDFVEHQRFGKGLVLELDGSGADKKAKIRFKGIGEKNLLLNFAKLKKIPPFGKEELF